MKRNSALQILTDMQIWCSYLLMLPTFPRVCFISFQDHSPPTPVWSHSDLLHKLTEFDLLFSCVVWVQPTSLCSSHRRHRCFAPSFGSVDCLQRLQSNAAAAKSVLDRVCALVCASSATGVRDPSEVPVHGARAVAVPSSHLFKLLPCPGLDCTMLGAFIYDGSSVDEPVYGGDPKRFNGRCHTVCGVACVAPLVFHHGPQSVAGACACG